jgi:hypothetical protein
MKRALVVSAALAVAGLLLISESASAGMYGGGFDGGGFRGGFVGAGFRPGFGVGPRWGYRPWYGIGRGYGLGSGLAAGGAALAVRYPYNGWYPYEGYGLAGYPDAGYGYGLADGGCYRILAWVPTIYYGLQQAWVTRCY